MPVPGPGPIVRGEPDGFPAYFAEAEPRLRRALVAKLGADRGREATAEALAWAFEHWDDVQVMDNGIGYLYRVGVSRTRERKADTRSIRGVRAADSVGRGPEPEEIEPEVWAALWALTEKQRIAVVLVHGYGWSMREVGELLEVSVPTVGTHLRRGLKHLRRRLAIGAGGGAIAESGPTPPTQGRGRPAGGRADA